MLFYDSKISRMRDQADKWASRDASDDRTISLPTEAAINLQSKIVGQVVLPGDPDYDEARMLANPRFSAFPIAIVYCEVDSDVSESLSFAQSLNVAVVVRSGGHSTAGFSSQSGGLLIDVSRLNDVVVDPLTRTAWAGPGTNFRKFNAKIEAFNLHTPGGACPDVCIGGYMQGGGYGFTARIFGMHCDQVVAVRLMLADGQTIYADASSNPDIFWAIRGGTGSNFGVLLGVKYRLYEGKDFCGFSITWSMTGEDGAKNTANALCWLQKNFMRTGAPDDLGYQMIWSYQGPQDALQPFLLMRGMFRGETDELKNILAPVLELPGASLQALYERQPYSVLNEILLSKPYEVPNFPADMTPMPPPEAKLSRYLSSPLEPEAWLKLVEYYLKTPSPYTTAAMEIYGGAIEKVGFTSNAFIHREVYCDLFFDVFWVNDQQQKQMLEYLDGWKKLVEPHWSGFVYQNYPSPHDADFGAHYWGDFYPVLRAIKTKYDPGNLFSYPQSIKLLEELTPELDIDGLRDPIDYEIA